MNRDRRMIADGELYERAQLAIVGLKSAVLMLLIRAGSSGLRNVEIGRALGIYDTPSGQQMGWVSAYCLELLEAEGQIHRINSTPKWAITS